MKHYPLIRTIYLYLFTLLGLTLLTIGGVRFIDMGLKALVFTGAEQNLKFSYFPPLASPAGELEKIAQNQSLSEQEKEKIKKIIEDYENWQKQRDAFDPVSAKRQRDASFNLALILVGLPLYLYHWRIIKRETKNSKEEN
ncbi:MAG TPA: hypothetical protein ENL33_00395 [Candidatus Parcubacteria bacterium]|nr:hypothetical protein [Candidatus Parcubacteria bacterium]